MAREIALTRGLVALVDDEDVACLDGYRWCVMGDERRGLYAVTTQHRAQYMHRLIMKPPAGFEVDHISRDSLDNRRANLRICTRAENMRNRSYTRKSPGLRGTAAHGNKYRAQITVNRKQLYLGLFETEAAAGQAYDRAAVEHFGEFAILNFPAVVA